MTNEELNTALYENMFAEQEHYREDLLGKPPNEILEHAYAYTIREDILLSLEYNDLTDKQCTAMLKSEHPLEDVLNKWENSETPRMDNIRNIIESTVNDRLRADFIKEQHGER